jgi:hypothetical protein
LQEELFFGAIDSRRPQIAEGAFESYVRKSGVHREVEPLSMREVLPR